MARSVVRFSASVPPELLKEFDEAIARMGYDRSKAIQLAMRNFLTEYKWEREEGIVVGTITIVYDHGIKGLEEDLIDIQHLHREVISSTMHIHLDEVNCLLVIALKGEANAIRGLVESLMGKRGVKQFKLTVVTS